MARAGPRRDRRTSASTARSRVPPRRRSCRPGCRRPPPPAGSARQPLLRRVGQRRHRRPCADQSVGGQDRRPAGVGDDRRRGGPRGSGCAVERARRRRTAPRCVSTRMHAGLREAARRRRVGAGQRAPVWLTAARAPGAVRPAFTATIGLRRPTRRAIGERRGLPNDSRYSRMTSRARVVLPVLEQVVAGDVGLVAHRDERSRRRAELARDVEDRHARARRDCDDERRRCRRGGATGAKVAFRRTAGSVLRTPMQLGPTMRMPCGAHAAAQLTPRPRAPSSPVSAKPAEITTRPRTPASPALIDDARARAAAGTAITARSDGSGSAATEG